jgi:hypothetical protein
MAPIGKWLVRFSEHGPKKQSLQLPIRARHRVWEASAGPETPLSEIDGHSRRLSPNHADLPVPLEDRERHILKISHVAVETQVLEQVVFA